MELAIYVNYQGNCREAFHFYEQHLGGKLTSVTTFEGVPGIPEERKDKIMHARIAIGATILMGADIPNAEPMRSAYLTLNFDQSEEAEKIYTLLAEGGEIFTKMAETNLARRYAMLRDRFGANWMLLCQN